MNLSCDKLFSLVGGFYLGGKMHSRFLEIQTKYNGVFSEKDIIL